MFSRVKKNFCFQHFQCVIKCNMPKCINIHELNSHSHLLKKIKTMLEINNILIYYTNLFIIRSNLFPKIRKSVFIFFVSAF